jgi:hypothetical protein
MVAPGKGLKVTLPEASTSAGGLIGAQFTVTETVTE